MYLVYCYLLETLNSFWGLLIMHCWQKEAPGELLMHTDRRALIAEVADLFGCFVWSQFSGAVTHNISREVMEKCCATPFHYHKRLRLISLTRQVITQLCPRQFHGLVVFRVNVKLPTSLVCSILGRSDREELPHLVLEILVELQLRLVCFYRGNVLQFISEYLS